MGLFSLNWFKTKQVDELSLLKIEEQRIKNELLRKELTPTSTTAGTINVNYVDDSVKYKPYKFVKLVNSVLTIVLEDGSILSKPNATELDFLTARGASSEHELINIISDKTSSDVKTKEEKSASKTHAIIKGFQILSKLDDFEVKEGSIYLKGINRTLPPLLVEKFGQIAYQYLNGNPELAKWGKDLQQDEEYIGLKRFFMWCCLNPRAEVADKLYDFLDRNEMKITKQGFFIALRNVVTTDNSDPELVDAITNAYNKIKAVWKKKPSEFWLIENEGEYFIEKNQQGHHSGDVIGNLQDLYLDLPNMKGNRYTDNWTHTFDIRIGQVVSMPMKDCNWSTQDCAASGLHFAGHTAPYVLCGDTTVFTLHNPMKVVGIGEEKGRCYEYLPFMTTNVKEADEIMNDQAFDFLQLDEQYALNELATLKIRVAEGFTAETTKYQFNLPAISTMEINSIIDSLDAMKNEISNRISILD
jgi:hypothetical protein